MTFWDFHSKRVMNATINKIQSLAATAIEACRKVDMNATQTIG